MGSDYLGEMGLNTELVGHPREGVIPHRGSPFLLLSFYPYFSLIRTVPSINSEALTFVPKLNKTKNHENGMCADVSYFGFVATTNDDKTLSISTAQGTINLVVFYSTH